GCRGGGETGGGRWWRRRDRGPADQSVEGGGEVGQGGAEAPVAVHGPAEALPERAGPHRRRGVSDGLDRSDGLESSGPPPPADHSRRHRFDRCADDRGGARARGGGWRGG